MPKPNIETARAAVEQAIREASAASFMASRALMSVDVTKAGEAETFRRFAADFHELVYAKLDELDEKVRELVAATKH